MKQMLSYERANYYIFLTTYGFFEYLDKIIDDELMKEEKLEGIYLDLACCYGNTDKILSCLHNYVGENEYNEAEVFNLIMSFLSDRFQENKMNYLKISEILISLCHLFKDSTILNKLIRIEEYYFYYGEEIISETDYENIIIEFIKIKELPSIEIDRCKKDYSKFIIISYYIFLLLIIILYFLF